jgi:hypothetical protein
MTTADGWDLTVPEDVAELAAELRRHGVSPGQRLHILQPREPAKDESAEVSAPPRRFKFEVALLRSLRRG